LIYIGTYRHGLRLPAIARDPATATTDAPLANPPSAPPEPGDTSLPPAQVALTVNQVAVLLGMTPKAVYHRAERGQLPGVFRVGRSLRFRRADLLRLVAEGRGLSPTRSR
jgi:excisionase family DNA binding protein